METVQANTGPAASHAGILTLNTKMATSAASAAAAAATSSPSLSPQISSSSSSPQSASPSATSGASNCHFKSLTAANNNINTSSNNSSDMNTSLANGMNGSHDNSKCNIDHSAGATSPSSSDIATRNGSYANSNIKNGIRNNSGSSLNKSLRCAMENDTLHAEPNFSISTDESLEFVEKQHPGSVLAGINKLRQQKQFCDISLLIQEQEFQTHRAVLAACSPYLFDFLSCLEETTEQQPIYKLDKEIPAAGFTSLLDYMYTGRLVVPLENVATVYATSLTLKMEAATRACADFLSTHLSTANCLGIRRLTKDKDFKETVDRYICDNLEDIINSKDFYGLTELQVEVVGLDEEITDEAMERRMFSLVLDWAKNNLNDLKPKMDRLVEQVNVLYLDSDNTLRDCAQVEDLVLSSDDEMIQDYKIMARRRCNNLKNSSKGEKGKHTVLPIKNHAAQPFQKFSLNPEEALSVAEREWTIIAIHKNTDNAYLAIAMLDGHLMAVSVHVRPQILNISTISGSSSIDHLNETVTNGDSVINGARETDSPRGGSSPTNILRKASIIPLANMSTARCAMGAVEMDGKIVVCGGYDRGECLMGCEAFNLTDNCWQPMLPMQRARGRFSMAVLDGQLYACGGSDGWHELACVERYDPGQQKWVYVSNMRKHRSSHGVATMNGKLYCIGGCEGQHAMKDCEIYDPKTNKWSKIAPLNIARSQACVVVVEDRLLAIGGTDMWNTLNSVEIYDPDNDAWTFGTCLNTARRGAGIDVVEGQVVVVGGSDGSQSLASSEIFDVASNSWMMGPPTIVPRANLSTVVMGGRLFAVGGFSGKKFLSSIEWLDMEDMEWFGHTPRDVGRKLSEEERADSEEENVKR